jgi:hypothetical protein
MTAMVAPQVIPAYPSRVRWSAATEVLLGWAAGLTLL